MTDSHPAKQILSRREALKTLAAVSGAGLTTLPGHWEKPLIEVAALPVHAMISPVRFPFTNDVAVRVEENGQAYNNFTWSEDQGWVGVYIDPAVQKQDAGGRRPWRRLRRRNVGLPFWSPGPIVVFLTLTFTPVDILRPRQIPRDKIFCYGYGRFGGQVYNGVFEENIRNGEVEIAYPLPVGFTGWFFFSCYFPSIIVLEDETEINATAYCGPALYGPNCPYAADDDEDDVEPDIETKKILTLGDFQITFNGVSYSGGQSTWTYSVEELSAPPELSKLVLALPLLDCGATINNSSPTGAEVKPDPDSMLSGIEWTTAVPDFTTGDFEVTLSGEIAVGLVDVAVKDSNDIVRIGQIAGPVCQQPVAEVTLSNCYKIIFLGAVDNNGDGTSTWRYQVEELACAQDLSNWVLALPFACTNIVGASPEPWEQVTPDPNANLNGIKWQTGAGFIRGVFEVTLQGQLGVELEVGLIDVAAKGPDVAFGQINGPVCL